jgi:Uma2 family endonuclease
LREAFGSGHTVRTQAPISLGDDLKPSEPQPDITVAVGAWRDYAGRNPSPDDVKLIVEIADSSLQYDRSIKSALYASAGILEYWIVNLAEKSVEVYTGHSEQGYAALKTYTEGDTITPVLAPSAAIAVSDFML